MTTLTQLAELTGGTLLPNPEAGTVTVDSATLNSAEATASSLFCGVPGTRAHGARYASDSGAAAVLTDAEGASIIGETDPEMPILVVDDVRRWMGDVSAEIYGHPSSKLYVIGITGTSGKTTTSYLVESALRAKHKVGIIGTTGTRIDGKAVETKLTTPEAPTMQALLARMVSEGVTHVVMEVSSHALALGRVRGIGFDVTAFTNLSQDHLDFHPSMEDYFDTKASLFSAGYGDPIPVVCADDEWGQKLAHSIGNAAAAGVSAAEDVEAVPTAVGGAEASATAERNVAQLSYVVTTDTNTGEQIQDVPGRHWCADDVHVLPSGEQDIHVSCSGCGPLVEEAANENFDYRISLAGSFNVANSLIALACVDALGERQDGGSPRNIARALADVQVPGRMQAVSVGQPFLAMVDYAHKPGAVASVVNTLADYMPSPEGRIGMVLGAGGNRDHDKRPIMGYEAARVADAVFVTDDNPRDEEPADIREQVLKGAEQAASEKKDRTTLVENIADRAEAIARAVAWARPGDAIVVAGKGHERGQLVAGVMHEFDDVEVLTRELEKLVAGQGQEAQE